MKFYLTVEPLARIKKVFVNLNAFFILNVEEEIGSLHLDMSKPSNIFYANLHMRNLIAAQAKSKRIQGIIYLNKNINTGIIDSLYEYIKEIPTIDGMVLMDDGFCPKMKDYHKLFEEILFFPTIKRVKILECKPFNIENLEDK